MDCFKEKLCSSCLFSISDGVPSKQCGGRRHGKVQCGNYGSLLSHFFGKKIREISVFTREVTKELIWRNICSMSVNSRNFTLCRARKTMIYDSIHSSLASLLLFWGEKLKNREETYMRDRSDISNACRILFESISRKNGKFTV